MHLARDALDQHHALLQGAHQALEAAEAEVAAAQAEAKALQQAHGNDRKNLETRPLYTIILSYQTY